MQLNATPTITVNSSTADEFFSDLMNTQVLSTQQADLTRPN